MKRYRNAGFLERYKDTRPPKPQYFPDDEVRGLVAILNTNGSFSWAVRGDLRENGKRVKSVRRVIGTYPEMSQQSARETARAELKLIKRALPADDPSQWTVAQAIAAHCQRDIGAKHRKDLNGYLRRHLAHWADKKLRDIRRKDTAELHEQLSKIGKPTADKVLKALSMVYNTAFKRSDEGTLPPNPIRVAVEYHALPPGEQADITDLGLWFKQLAALPHEGRRLMFLFGLYSGLRPGLLAVIQRSWITADTLVIPRSELGKAKRRPGAFRVPLTPSMMEIVDRALAFAQATAPTSPYLFPGKLRGQPWSSWDEPSMLTGKSLRRKHFQIAIDVGVSLPVAEMLADRALPSAGRFYIGDPEKAKREAQQRISDHLDQIRNSG